jgi:hypothetical protein
MKLFHDFILPPARDGQAPVDYAAKKKGQFLNYPVTYHVS